MAKRETRPILLFPQEQVFLTLVRQQLSRNCDDDADDDDDDDDDDGNQGPPRSIQMYLATSLFKLSFLESAVQLVATLRGNTKS